MWALWARPYWLGYVLIFSGLSSSATQSSFIPWDDAADDVHAAADRRTTFAEDDVSRALSDGDIVHRICRVTAYCDRGLTAAGVPSGMGQCAAPADIPFGTHVYIPALDRTFVVTDRTAERFRRNTVDLFIPDCDVCVDFGRHYLEVVFTLPEHPVRYGSPEMRGLARTYARAE